MSENTDIPKREKRSKSSARIDEAKDVKNTLENKKRSVKKKGERDAVQYLKKKHFKQPMKQKNKSENTTEKLSVPNILLNNDKKMCEYQIQKLNLMFKQSSNCPTLTQEELNMLFVKYKSDGHYRANKMLPSFTSFSKKTCNVTDENNQFSNQLQYIPTYNAEEINTKNSTNPIVNPYCNIDNETQSVKENLSIYENTESNLKYLPKSTEISETNNLDNLTGNKYFFVDCNSFNNNNYNRMFTNHDLQIYQSNINASNDIQNSSQSRSDLNTKNISNREDHSLYDLVGDENVAKEHHNYKHTNQNLLYNIFDSNVQYENLNNNEISQQNEIHGIKYNGLQLNSDFCNNTCSNKWNADKNNNQFYTNAQLSRVSRANVLKSCYNLNNSMPALNINTLQDFNPYFANVNTILEDLTEPNSYALSCVDIADQLI